MGSRQKAKTVEGPLRVEKTERKTKSDRYGEAGEIEAKAAIRASVSPSQMVGVIHLEIHQKDPSFLSDSFPNSYQFLDLVNQRQKILSLDLREGLPELPESAVFRFDHTNSPIVNIHIETHSHKNRKSYIFLFSRLMI